jgi:uncharacterized protein
MKRDDFLDMNDALQHPGRKIEVDISTDLSDESEVEIVEPVEGYLEAYSTGNLLIVEGEFKTRCCLQCARCGGPLEQDVTFEIKEDFNVEGVPSMYAQDDYAKVVTDEPYPLFEENNLMVESLIRQALIVSLPVQALCTYGWDGDCPEAKNRKVELAPPKSVKLSGLEQFIDQEEGNP